MLRLVGEVRPLDGERGLVREGLELMELIGRIERVPIRRTNADHAHGAARRLQWQVEGGGAGEGGGAEPGRLMMLVHPLGHAELIRVDRVLTAARRLKILSTRAR